MFGSLKAPHALPRFAIDKLLLQEVYYQMSGGFTKVLTKGKKNPWPTLPLTISTYTVKYFREVEAEAEQMRSFRFPPLAHRTYDPMRVILAHCKYASLDGTINTLTALMKTGF